jgi:molybdate-binding protein
VAAGAHPPGRVLPSARSLAEDEGVSQATVLRAYRELARAGVIVTQPRRAPRIAPQGELAARRLLREGAIFRLAGSDDPALALLLSGVGEAIARVGARASFAGLQALWEQSADGAALHLWHRSGAYNEPYARHLSRSRRPLLVHLWRREQGLIVPPGNPRQIAAANDLRALRVARRPVGTGTRALLDRLIQREGRDPDGLPGPTVRTHLDVAIAVASGQADAGLGLRGPAEGLGLEFVPLAWEPFEIATGEEQLGGLEPLLAMLRDPARAAAIAALGGYDLGDAGTVRAA